MDARTTQLQPEEMPADRRWTGKRAGQREGSLSSRVHLISTDTMKRRIGSGVREVKRAVIEVSVIWMLTHKIKI